MDAEFGVSDIVQSQIKKPGKVSFNLLVAFKIISKVFFAQEYSSKQLSGLTVQHSKSSFVDGQDTILVLQDRGTQIDRKHSTFRI